jgi:hypothetical protein
MALVDLANFIMLKFAKMAVSLSPGRLSVWGRPHHHQLAHAAWRREQRADLAVLGLVECDPR